MTTLNIQPNRKQQQQRQPQLLNDDHGYHWRSLVDPRTGSPYYCNVKTGKTQWTRPTDALILPFLPTNADNRFTTANGHPQQHRDIVRTAIGNVNAINSSVSSLDTASHHRNLNVASFSSTSSGSNNSGFFLLDYATPSNHGAANSPASSTSRDQHPQVVHQHQNRCHPVREQSPQKAQVYPSSTPISPNHGFLGSDVLGAEAQERYRLPQGQICGEYHLGTWRDCATLTTTVCSSHGLLLGQQPSTSLPGRVQEHQRQALATSESWPSRPQLISSQPQPMCRASVVPSGKNVNVARLLSQRKPSQSIQSQQQQQNSASCPASSLDPAPDKAAIPGQDIEKEVHRTAATTVASAARLQLAAENTFHATAIAATATHTVSKGEENESALKASPKLADGAMSAERIVWVKFGLSNQLAFLMSVQGDKATVRWESTKLKEEVSLDRIEEMKPRGRRASQRKVPFLHRIPYNAELTPPSSKPNTVAKITPEEDPPVSSFTASVSGDEDNEVTKEEEPKVMTLNRIPMAGNEAESKQVEDKATAGVAEKETEVAARVMLCETPSKAKSILALKLGKDKPKDLLTKHMNHEANATESEAHEVPAVFTANPAIEVDRHEKERSEALGAAAVFIVNPAMDVDHYEKELNAIKTTEKETMEDSTKDHVVIDVAGSGKKTLPREDAKMQGVPEYRNEDGNAGLAWAVPRKARTRTKNFFEAALDKTKEHNCVVMADNDKGKDDKISGEKAEALVEEVPSQQKGSDELKFPSREEILVTTTTANTASKCGAQIALNLTSEEGVTIIFDKEEGSKLGISLTAIKDRIFITKVEKGGLIAMTDLRVGMEIHSINEVLVPKTLAGAAKMLMEATGVVTVVAFARTLVPLKQSKDKSKVALRTSSGKDEDALQSVKGRSEEATSASRISAGSGDEVKQAVNSGPTAEDPKADKGARSKEASMVPGDLMEPEGPDWEEDAWRSSFNMKAAEWEPKKPSKPILSATTIATRRSRRASKSLCRIETSASPKANMRGGARETNGKGKNNPDGSRKKRKRGCTTKGGDEANNLDELRALKMKHVGEIDRVVTRQQSQLERIRRKELVEKQKEFEQFEAQREASSKQWEAALKEREATLEEREPGLVEQEACLGVLAATLEQKEASLEHQKSCVDLAKDVRRRESRLDSYGMGIVDSHEAASLEEEHASESDAICTAYELSSELPIEEADGTSRIGDDRLSAKSYASNIPAPVILGVQPANAESNASPSSTAGNGRYSENVDSTTMTLLSASTVAIFPADAISTTPVTLQRRFATPASSTDCQQQLALRSLPSTIQTAAMPQKPATRSTTGKAKTAKAISLKKVKNKKSHKSFPAGGFKTSPVAIEKNETAVTAKNGFLQPETLPVSDTTIVKPTKKDAVFGRGRKKSNVRQDNLYRELIETNCTIYSRLDVSNYNLRRKFVKESIIDPILKSGGRFIMRLGVALKLLDVNDKVDLRLIYKKIQRALFNERKRREYMGPPGPGAIKAASRTSSKRRGTQSVQPQKREEKERGGQEGETPAAASKGEDGLGVACIEGFEYIDMITAENENSVFNLGFSFDDDFGNESAVVSADAAQERYERRLVDSTGTAPAPASPGCEEITSTIRGASTG